MVLISCFHPSWFIYVMQAFTDSHNDNTNDNSLITTLILMKNKTNKFIVISSTHYRSGGQGDAASSSSSSQQPQDVEMENGASNWHLVFSLLFPLFKFTDILSFFVWGVCFLGRSMNINFVFRLFYLLWFIASIPKATALLTSVLSFLPSPVFNSFSSLTTLRLVYFIEFSSSLSKAHHLNLKATIFHLQHHCKSFHHHSQAPQHPIALVMFP